MLRITTWRSTGTPATPVTPQQAIDNWNGMCKAVSALQGAGEVRWFFGSGGIVTVGEADTYAVADAILTSPETQVAIGRVLAMGYALAEDHFLLEPAQVLPFAQQSSAAPAQISRN